MNRINIYPELKKIVSLNVKRQNLAKSLENKIETDVLDFEMAYFVSGCKEKKGNRWFSTATGRNAQRDTHLICYYAVLDGQARGCPADRCDKYEKREKSPINYGRHNYDS